MRIPPTDKHRPSLDDDVTFETPGGRRTGIVTGIDGDLYVVLVGDQPHQVTLKRIVSFTKFDSKPDAMRYEGVALHFDDRLV